MGNTGVLISPYPVQEGNKQMFLSEWREFPSAPCLALQGKNGADKSLARPGRKQANVSVRIAQCCLYAVTAGSE